MRGLENTMDQIIITTIKGILRDRVFHGIMVSALFFLFVPSLASFSMRQAVELSITLSLSLISFILLLLAVFLGGGALWKDIERRYSFSVLSLPISRSSYLLGKFFGIAVFLFATVLFLGLIGVAVVYYSAGHYPSQRAIAWAAIFAAIVFIFLKYVLLVAFAVLFSTVSTSFFLPIFGTLAMFLVGGSTQQVYDYLHSSSGQSYSPFIAKTASILYYLLPNFDAFDLTVNAIYGIPLNGSAAFITLLYFVTYTAVLLTLSSMAFQRRELE